MKFCPECGSAVGNGKFCPECGHRLTLSDGGVQTERDEAELLAPFETVRHQNGKYAILALKNKSELIVEVPACVESIMDGAFMNSCVMKVTLPEGLVQIRDNAFAGCKDLVQINFPSTLIAIGTRAFSGCEQLDVAPPSSVRLGYNAFAFTAYNHRVVREEYERKQAEEERRRREAEEARRREQEERERDPEYCLQTAQSYEKSAQNHSLDKEKYYKNAFSMYCKAAQLGNAEGQFQVGRYYASGIAIERDDDEALRWYHKAAAQKHAVAERTIGYCYLHGHMTAQNKVEGIRWLKKAMEHGDTFVERQLWEIYFEHMSAVESMTESLEWWKKIAKNGSAMICRNLGDLYYYGKEVTRDYSEAVVWYRKAAEAGDAQARFVLGECYHYGRGVTIDHAQALKWYSSSGTPQARFMAGEHYYHGWGVPRDLKLANEWYRYGGPGCGTYWCDGEPYRDVYKERTAQAWARMGDIAWEEEDYSSAKGRYEEALKQGMNEVRERLGKCYGFMAEKYLRQGKINEASSACENAIKYGYSVSYSLREEIEKKKAASSSSWYRKCWGGG